MPYFQLDSGVLQQYGRPPTPEVTKDPFGAAVAGFQVGQNIALKSAANRRADEQVEMDKQEIATRAEQEEYNRTLDVKAEERAAAGETRAREDAAYEKTQRVNTELALRLDREKTIAETDKLEAQTAQIRAKQGTEAFAGNSDRVGLALQTAMKGASNKSEAADIGLRFLTEQGHLLTNDAYEKALKEIPDPQTQEDKMKSDNFLRMNAGTAARSGNSGRAKTLIEGIGKAEGKSLFSVTTTNPTGPYMEDTLVLRFLKTGIDPEKTAYYGDGAFEIQEIPLKEISTLAGNDGQQAVQAYESGERSRLAAETSNKQMIAKQNLKDQEQRIRERYNKLTAQQRDVKSGDMQTISEVIANIAPNLNDTLIANGSAQSATTFIMQNSRGIQYTDGLTPEDSVIKAILEYTQSHNIYEPSLLDKLFGGKKPIWEKAEQSDKPVTAGVPEQRGGVGGSKYTEEDIQFTMKKNNLTREEVMDALLLTD